MENIDRHFNIAASPIKRLAPAMFFFAMTATLYLFFRIYLRATQYTIDEIEQLQFANALQLGYPNQPPLYNWVQYLFFWMFGKNVYALAGCKAFFLACCAWVYRHLCLLHCAHQRQAWCATVALSLIPSIGYTLLNDTTHSITALLCACLTWYAFVRPWPRLTQILVLGVSIALGFLSKFNYVLFLVVFLASALSLNTISTRQKNTLLFSVLLAGVLASPYGWWMLTHPLGMGMAYKLWPASSSTVHGLLRLMVSVFAFASPFALVSALVFQSPFWRSSPPLSWSNQLLERYILLSIPLLLAITLVFSWGTFKARWLICILFVLPIAYFSRFDASPLPAHQAKRFMRLCIAVEVVWLLLILMRDRLH